MYWVYILLALYVPLVVYFIVGVAQGWGERFIATATVWTIIVLSLFFPLAIVGGSVQDKYDWYIEIRLKYAEAEGVEKMYLEMTDVMTYNLWYEQNKEDLENPWNFKSAAGCEFDYIKVGDLYEERN